MGWQRSSFVAIVVTEEQFPKAVDFYQRAFDMTISATAPGTARLTGEGFTLIVRAGEPAGLVLQDFEHHTYGPRPERHPAEQLLELGCELIEVNGESQSPAGYLVKDPYGMTYQLSWS